MTVRTNPAAQSKIEAAFWQFHGDHPEVYVELVALCRELRQRGYERFGIATVYEVCRWRSMIHAAPGESFKLNNNYRAYYARLIMETERDLAGVFNTRVLTVPSHVAP